MRDYNTKKLHYNGPALKYSKMMKKPQFNAVITDRVVFQRFLGHYEILNGYRWQEVDQNDCYICQEWAYCIYIYDRRLAHDVDVYH